MKSFEVSSEKEKREGKGVLQMFDPRSATLNYYLGLLRTCRFSSHQNQRVSEQRKVRLALRLHVPGYPGLDGTFCVWKSGSKTQFRLSNTVLPM